MYRHRFGGIKSKFAKQGEYGLYGKLNFLAPNHLLALNKSASELKKMVKVKDEEFIILLELFKSGVIRLTSSFEETIPAIDKLIEDLEHYKNSK